MAATQHRLHCSRSTVCIARTAVRIMQSAVWLQRNTVCIAHATQSVSLVQQCASCSTLQCGCNATQSVSLAQQCASCNLQCGCNAAPSALLAQHSLYCSHSSAHHAICSVAATQHSVYSSRTYQLTHAHLHLYTAVFVLFIRASSLAFIASGAHAYNCEQLLMRTMVTQNRGTGRSAQAQL